MNIAESAPIQQMWCSRCCSIQPIRMIAACWHCGSCGSAGDVGSCACPARALLHLAANTVHPTPGLDRIRARTSAASRSDAGGR